MPNDNEDKFDKYLDVNSSFSSNLASAASSSSSSDELTPHSNAPLAPAPAADQNFSGPTYLMGPMFKQDPCMPGHTVAGPQQLPPASNLQQLPPLQQHPAIYHQQAPNAGVKTVLAACAMMPTAPMTMAGYHLVPFSAMAHCYLQNATVRSLSSSAPYHQNCAPQYANNCAQPSQLYPQPYAPQCQENYLQPMQLHDAQPFQLRYASPLQLRYAPPSQAFQLHGAPSLQPFQQRFAPPLQQFRQNYAQQGRMSTPPQPSSTTGFSNRSSFAAVRTRRPANPRFKKVPTIYKCDHPGCDQTYNKTKCSRKEVHMKTHASEHAPTMDFFFSLVVVKKNNQPFSCFPSR